MSVKAITPRRLNRAVQWASTALMLCGFGMILAYAWTRVDETLYQTVQRSYLPATPPSVPMIADTPSMDPTQGLSNVHSRPPAVARLFQSPLVRRWAGPDSEVLGMLFIPKLSIDVVIREGTDPATLRRALGHVPSTALPGGEGNFVVTGHRDTFFRQLRNIRPSDEIIGVTVSGVYTYRVYGISVVRPDYVEVLRPTHQPECTLVTCFPFNFVGTAPRRFVVQARLVRRMYEPERSGQSSP